MIHYIKTASSNNARFSILIPTWNNLNYLKICINSIRKNSKLQHQIILHINEGNDGTLEWVKSQHLDYTFSEKNIGICYAMNAAATLADADYIVYMNDDMYVCPEWDLHIMNEIDKIGHEYFFLSATLIEPSGYNPSFIAPNNFGKSYSDFDEKSLLEQYDTFQKTDWNGSSWPPSIMHRRIWSLVGGYSTEYFPGMYSDPDLSMKLWHSGVRIFKGVGKSRVYHFMTKSTGKLKVKSNGRKLFLQKWGITASVFYKYYLKMSSRYDGPLSNPVGFIYKLAILKCKLKRLL